MISRLASHDAPTGPDSAAALWRVPALVFALTLLVTGSMAMYLLRAIERSDAGNFAHEVERTAQAMQERLDLTLTLLRGAAGLFTATEHVSREEFHHYVSRLRLGEQYHGIQGIGYTVRLAPEDVAAFEQQQRDAGLPQFRVWPDTPRDEYHSIVYLEPQDARNRAAMGYDMFTHPVRRAAMEAARDSGRPRATGKVVLVQEIHEDKQAGFLIYLPVYGPAHDPGTVQQRRQALRGFVYSPLRVGDLLRGVRGSSLQHLDYALYDGETASPGTLMRRTHDDPRRTARFLAQRTLQVAGRSWRVEFSSRPEFEALSSRRFAPWAFAASLAASLLLAGITSLQVRRRHAAQQLARAGARNIALVQQLRLNARRKDEFLAMLGHELRNPLAPIVSSVGALKRGVATDRAQRLYEIIERQARQLTHLVNDLLEAGRITTGRIMIRPRSMVIDEAVRNATEALQVELQRRGQRLQIQHRGTPAPLQADPIRLAQVLGNLLHNASKFSPHGATLELHIDERPDHLVLQVADPGRGMSPETQEQVFELFMQGDRPEDMTHGGLGIGLALVKHLVELHGGQVTAHSEGRGRGSVFTVTLPREPGRGAQGSR
ncbi:MAG: CHASE domain-containing protein [Pseudomonadota bacterium]